MKKLFLLILLLALASMTIYAQSTSFKVYEILQGKCAGCHATNDAAAGLDLEGVGSDIPEKAASVYETLMTATPSSDFANGMDYPFIYPGRVDKSFLFRQINEGFEPFIDLQNGEGIHPEFSNPLIEEEKELLRQWILYGAPETGVVVDESLIHDYYNVNGMPSLPDGRPEAPAADEGFQMKMGPFYLPPNGEIEYFQKYELDLPANVDVNRLDIKMSGFSHHFIISRFGEAASAANVEDGLRLDNDHSDISLVASVGEAKSINLPEGTAFKWEEDIVLDLNSHYINYSATNTLQAEIYINVYTKPEGTAAQEMRTRLIPYPNIYIPNTGDLITHTSSFSVPPNFFEGNLYIWSIGGHTHRYGTGYKVWTQTEAGEKGDLIYDGSCPLGVPDCPSPFFDYQHIPNRTFDNLLPVDANKGFIHEATWINDGPEPVAWGPTSEDEMMLFGVMFVLDTTGLNLSTHTPKVENTLGEIQVFPNPMTKQATINLPSDVGLVNFYLYDMLGNVVRQMESVRETTILIEKKNLPKGLYVFRIENEKGQRSSGKIVVK